MITEALVETGRVAEILPIEVCEWYQQYAKTTWNSVDAMIYPQTGLPSDHLHYLTEDGWPTEETSRIDKTSPTNIGFSLACVGAATAMGFISASEANQRIDLAMTTIESMMEDPGVFISTDEGKGLFVNWIQPSTGKVLKNWPESSMPVKQQVSTVDNAWLIAFSKLVSAQFPHFSNRIQHFLNQIDLPFMFDSQKGFFHGCYLLNPPGFESWQYDVISEARIAYLVCGENIAEQIGNLINRRSQRSVFVDSTGLQGRATWDGEYFAIGWPSLIIPESRFSSQWRDTHLATIQMQREFGIHHNGGHYGYSAGLDPDGKYYEFRVPGTGENRATYQFHPVVTISALVNMGIIEPIETFLALQQLHQDFPHLTHVFTGDGDTVNTQTGAVQRDQIFPNQAAILLACWNIVKDCEPQNLFMETAPDSLADIYRYPLW